jgi:FMN phosphatase YigB (HAD superfamily)
MTKTIKNKLLNPCRIKNILLDFDGTLTNVVAESRSAIKKWDELYCEKTGIPISELNSEFNYVSKLIINDKKSGWVKDGYVVAPALADPLVFTTAVYQKIIERQILKGVYPLDPNQDSIDALLYELFSKSYPYSKTIFRTGAKEFLDELTSQYTVTIVTNSKTDAVASKLNKLVDYSVPIIGNAKKYSVGTEPSFVPEQITLEGFPRPIFLRRSDYYNILKEFDAEETAVIGDIYELDLALPEYLGFRAIQLETLTTPKYELERKNTPDYKLAGKYNSILKMLKK